MKPESRPRKWFEKWYLTHNLETGNKCAGGRNCQWSQQRKTCIDTQDNYCSIDTDLPFTLRRRQFPVRPCFAMSTNKAQGQTLEFVGIYLPDHVFTHGQLYVAFSRVTRSSAVAVYVNNKEGFTKNIVYNEVL